MPTTPTTSTTGSAPAPTPAAQGQLNRQPIGVSHPRLYC